MIGAPIGVVSEAMAGHVVVRWDLTFDQSHTAIGATIVIVKGLVK